MSKVKRALALFMIVFMTCTMVPANLLHVEAATVKAKSVTLNKSVYTLKKGKKVTLKATIAPKNTTQKKLEWKSSNKKVATVSSKGVVTAKKNGTTTITVKVKGTSKKATCKITVGTPVTKVKLNKTKLSLKPKKSSTLKVTVSPSKATSKKVTWKSSNTKVATVSSKGKVKAKKAGTTTITATAKDGTGKKATCKVTVGKPVTKIKLNTTKATLNVGKTTTLKPTVSPSSATTKTVTYKSSNTKVATVSSKGKITAKKAGTATITVSANDASGKKATCKVTVIQPVTKVALNKTSVTLNVGKTETVKATISPSDATNKKVTYKSSNANVATVDAYGKITANKAGTATITATAADGSGKTATCSVTVKQLVTGLVLNKTSVTLDVGKTETVKATVSPSNASNKGVTYKSSDESVATVSSSGVITAKKAGTATITATAADGSGKKATCTVTVKQPVTEMNFSESQKVITLGENYQTVVMIGPDDAYDKSVSYSSSDEAIASIDENGFVTANKVGTVIITAKAKDGSGVTATMELTVDPIWVREIVVPEEQKSVVIKVGESFDIEAAVQPENATNKNLTYATSDRYRATVDENGKVEAKTEGNAYITISSEDGKASTIISVKVEKPDVAVTGVKLNRKEAELMMNSSPIQLVAIVKPEDATNQNVSWTSANPDVAAVTPEGIVHPVAEGETTITVKTLDGEYTAECTVKVQNGVRVTTSQELLDVLEGEEDYNLIEFVSETEESFVLSATEGKDYTDTILSIDAPNASITNNINYKKVEINNIKSETYIENANNKIKIHAPNSRIIINETAKVKLDFGRDVESTKLVNNGEVENLVIDTNGEIDIEGTSSQVKIPTVIEGKAKISTSKALEIVAEEKATILLKAGAEGTTVDTEDKDNIPSVSGIGQVEITIGGTDKDTIIAEPTDEETNAGEIETLTGVVNDITGNPIEGAKVYLIPYDSDFNMGDFGEEASWTDETDENGEYALSNIKVGNYYLLVKREGYLDVKQTCIFTTGDAAGGTKINTPVIMSEVTEEVEKGSVSGIITDAYDGKPIEGLTIRVRNGQNNISGETCADDVRTGSDGKYTVTDLEPGTYTIQVLDLRNAEHKYITTNFNVYIEPGKETENMGTAISPEIESDQVRFVLTWGNEESGAPRDLDSHMIGPRVDGEGQFHVFFGDDEYYENESLVTGLDVDDTSWEGPETTTIYENTPGVYYYCIHDFTNGGSSSSEGLAKSGAKVEVYIGERLLQTFSVPNKEGTLWTVCSFSTITNSVTPINEMSYESDSEGVGSDFRYGDLKVTDIKTNDLITDAVISSSSIKLKVVGELGADNLDQIVPVIAQKGAAYRIEYNEENDLFLTITGTDGVERQYWLRIVYDYKDLYIEGFEINDIVTSFDINEYDDYSEIVLTMNNTDVESCRDKIIPVIAQKGATYEINKITYEDEESVNWSLVIKGENGVTRTYELYIRQEYGNLKVNSVSCSDDSMIDHYVGSSYIDIYGTKQSWEDVKDSITFEFGEDVDSYTIDMNEYGEGDLVLTRKDGLTRRYYVCYYVSWGDLYIDRVTSDHEAVREIENEDNSVWLYLENMGLTEEVAKSLSFTYAKEGVTGETKQDEEGNWYHEYTDGNLVRKCYINCEIEWGESLSIISAERGPGIALVELNHDWSEVYIEGTWETLAEALENVKFVGGEMVENITFEPSEDSARDGYLILTGPDDIMRSWYVYYNTGYGNVNISNIVSNSENVGIEWFDSWEMSLRITDSVFTEEMVDSLDIVYGSEDVTGTFEYDAEQNMWVLVYTDGRITRKCNISSYTVWSEAFSINSAKKGPGIAYVEIDQEGAYIWFEGTWNTISEALENVTFEYGEKVKDITFEPAEGEEGDWYGELILTADNGTARRYSINYNWGYGGVDIQNVVSTSDEVKIEWADSWDMSLIISDSVFTEELGNSLEITYGSENVTGSFEYDEENDKWALVYTDGHITRRCVIYSYTYWSEKFSIISAERGQGIGSVEIYQSNDCPNIWFEGTWNTITEALEHVKFELGEKVETITFEPDSGEWANSEGTLIITGYDGTTREYEIYYNGNSYGDVYINNVVSKYDDVTVEYSSENYISLIIKDRGFIEELGDVLDITYANANVEGTFKYDAEMEKWTLVITDGYITRICDVSVYYEFSAGFGIDFWGRLSDNIADVDLSVDTNYITFFVYDEITIEEAVSQVEFEYGSLVEDKKFDFESPIPTLTLTTADGRTRIYELYVAQYYGDLYIIEASGTNDDIAWADIHRNREGQGIIKIYLNKGHEDSLEIRQSITCEFRNETTVGELSEDGTTYTLTDSATGKTRTYDIKVYTYSEW